MNLAGGDLETIKTTRDNLGGTGAKSWESLGETFSRAGGKETKIHTRNSRDEHEHNTEIRTKC